MHQIGQQGEIDKKAPAMMAEAPVDLQFQSVFIAGNARQYLPPWQ